MLLKIAAPLIDEDEDCLSVNKTNPASLRGMPACGASIHHEDAEQYDTRIPLER